MLVTTLIYWRLLSERRLIYMNKKMSELNQRPELINEGKKKESNGIEYWVIEEYFVPNQAS